MICLSIAKPNINNLLALVQAEKSRIVEIRLDGVDTPLSPAAISELFSLPMATIATCRVTDKRGEDERKTVLLDAIKAGADYVDIGIEADECFKQDILIEAHRHECKVIISYHDYEATPGRSQLKRIVEDCFGQGADIAKIACMVHSQADSANILSLYGIRFTREPAAIVALGMGEKGKITRIAAPLLGSPFTFAVPDNGKETAPGQLDESGLLQIYELMGFSNGRC